MFCIIFLPTIVKGDNNFCKTVENIIAYYSSDGARNSYIKLLEISYKDYNTSDGYKDLIVVEEFPIRGGSESMLNIIIYKGQSDNKVCEGYSINFQWDPNIPYDMRIIPDKYFPKIDITYQFLASNHAADYDTKSIYVSDFRNELYSYKDGAYYLEKKKILKCDVCAEKSNIPRIIR